MDEQIAITKVRQRLTLIQQDINVAKKRLLDLEAEAKKLMTTLEVLENLGEDSMSASDLGTTSQSGVTRLSDLLRLATGEGRSAGNILGSLLNPTTRQLIVAEFISGVSLSKNEVVERVKAKDANVNEGTVATTLSKLTAEGVLEKAEGNAYRLKVSPDAGSTGGIDDLLKT